METARRINISGTFRVSNSSNIGSLSIADLNVAINNVSMSAGAVPEPAAFAALAGFAVLGFVSLRRRAKPPNRGKELGLA